MPLVSVVFPVPNSPVSKTSTGAVRRFENSLPQLVVSSGECVMISSGTLAQLLEEFQPSVGHGVRNLTGEEAGQISSARCQLRRQAVKIDPEAQHARSVVRAELRSERREDSGEDIARSALPQAGIARCADKGL